MRTIYSDDGPEISDAIVSYDSDTLARLPVFKSELIDQFLALENQAAVRIVRALPAKNDVLDEAAVDQLLIKTHCELQRLSEEYFHGFRVQRFLEPFVKVIKNASGCGSPSMFNSSDSNQASKIRVVDIGCGTGYVIRWLAKYANLDGVELIGADYNAALIHEAERLANQENLNCKFVVANAFCLEEPATICFSTGVLHHFRDASLVEFFSNHRQPSLQAFFHFDFQPNAIAPVGSWVFHRIRMREPLARHDGVLSAARAHSVTTLLAAARAGAIGFESGMYGRKFWGTWFPRVFHTLVGVRPDLQKSFEKELSFRAVQLTDFEERL